MTFHGGDVGHGTQCFCSRIQRDDNKKFELTPVAILRSVTSAACDPVLGASFQALRE